MAILISSADGQPARIAAGIAEALRQVAEHVVTGGMLLGPDRVERRTRWGYGDDGVVGLGVVVEIAAALAIDSVDLLRRDRRYSAATLVRQMIECEYLLWLFGHKPDEARRWLNADQRELRDVFAPGRIREMSGGRFVSAEYHAHCELGGHPSPQARALLPLHSIAPPIAVLWTDLTLHFSRTWETLLETMEELHLNDYIPAGLTDSVAALRASGYKPLQ